MPDRTVYTAVAGKDIISAIGGSFAALLRFPWRPGTHIHCPETDEGIENSRLVKKLTTSSSYTSKCKLEPHVTLRTSHIAETG